MKIISTLALLCCLSFSAFAQSFGDYPAKVYKGRNAPVRIDKDSREFRSRLRWAIRNQKANFAGSYILTGWGCGAGCYMFAIIDARIGRVYFSGFSVQWQPPIEEPLLFRSDSRLLIVQGIRNEQGPQGRHYYEWQGGKFRFIKSIPL